MPRLVPHSTEASRLLCRTNARSRRSLTDVASALQVHPRTIYRWKTGRTTPSARQWTELVAYFYQFVPEDAVALAAAAKVPLPSAALPPTVEHNLIENALLRAADTLDVSPRRVRAALRDITKAVRDARGSLDDLARAAERSVETAS